MSDIFVQSFTHLKDKPNPDKALHMLQRVASLVKPIMRKRSWVLPVLAEFFPDNPNLLAPVDLIRFDYPYVLDVNMGEKILVRLRPPFSPDTFLLEDDVVQTMLHELTHNVHGPHDDKFYKYLSGLQDEYDELQRSGYAGEGFFSAGKRLGTNISHNLPPHLARMKALEAAEKRAKASRVLNGGGRLGGRMRDAGLSPRELAARAAERRLKDERSCGSGSNAKREAEIAASQSVENKVIDLTLDADEHEHQDGSNSDSEVIIVTDLHPTPKPSGNSNAIAGPSRTKNFATHSKQPAIRKSVNVDGRSSAVGTKNPNLIHKPSPSEWACPSCTLLNPASRDRCDACNTREPLDKQNGWSCLTCGESGMPHEFWTCSWCGTVKLRS